MLRNLINAMNKRGQLECRLFICTYNIIFLLALSRLRIFTALCIQWKYRESVCCSYERSAGWCDCETDVCAFLSIPRLHVSTTLIALSSVCYTHRCSLRSLGCGLDKFRCCIWTCVCQKFAITAIFLLWHPGEGFSCCNTEHAVPYTWLRS